MPKQLNFTLNDHDLKTLERAIKSDKRAAVRRRATAIRLLHLGYEVEEVAGMVATTVASVYMWAQRWREHGLEGLANQPKNAPKRKATATYRAALHEALGQEPSTYGYEFAVWTLETLRQHLIRTTGVVLSVVWLSNVLKEEGYVYRRPKHDLTHLQDANAKQQARELLDELKKGPLTMLSGCSLWTKPA